MCLGPFQKDQPDGKEEQNCAAMATYPDKVEWLLGWNDVRCGGKARFVCERKFQKEIFIRNQHATYCMSKYV